MTPHRKRLVLFASSQIALQKWKQVRCTSLSFLRHRIKVTSNFVWGLRASYRGLGQNVVFFMAHGFSLEILVMLPCI